MNLSRDRRVVNAVCLFQRQAGGALSAVPFDQVSAGCWLDDVAPGKILYQRVTDHAFLEVYGVATGETRVVDDFGANHFVAGGWQWACVSNRGYRDSHGTARPDWHPLAVDDQTGDIAICEPPNGDLYVWNGQVQELIARGQGFSAVFHDGLLRFWLGAAAFDWTRGRGARLVGSLAGVGFDDYSRGWNMGFYGGLRVIWPDWSPADAIIITKYDPEHHHPKLRADSQTALIVAAWGEGEVPDPRGVIREHLVDFAAGTVNGQPWEKIDLRAPIQVSVPDAPAPEPIRIPTFVATTQAIGIGIFDEPAPSPSFAGNWPAADTDKAVFCTVGRDNIPAAAALAKARNLPLAAYMDSPDYPGWQVPVVEGVTVRPLVQAYPRAGESVEAFATRLGATVKGLVDVGFPVDLVAATYCQVRGDGSFALTEQQVLDCLAVTWNLARAYRCGAIWCFNWKRPAEPATAKAVDGLVYWPNLMAAVQAMRASSRDWQHFPTVPLIESPVVVPEPPPLPPIIPSVPPEPPVVHGSIGKGKPVGKVGAIAALVAGIVSLFWRRKRKEP